MKRKIMMAVCFAAAICILSGCQLALEDAGENAYGDRFIGVFVTTEHLDLFDFESYLNDNISGLSGGNFVVEGNTKKYDERLYASLITRTLTNEETGETVETEEYVFENIEGIPYFSATVPASDGNGSYRTSISDPAISDGMVHIKSGDEADSTTMEGTIYISPASKERTCFFNPVYQGSDGSVYLTSGSGFMLRSQTLTEGEHYSQTIEDSCTITENGKSKTESTSITLSVSVMFEPEKIAVLQMDAESNSLSKAEYEPGDLPESLSLEDGTAYLIVETHKRDASGSPSVSRSIYSTDNESFETFSVREDGICVKKWTQIIWPHERPNNLPI